MTAKKNDSDRYADMYNHIRKLCDELEQTHGVKVEPAHAGELDDWTITWRIGVSGLPMAHTIARAMAKATEQIKRML